MGRKIGMFVSRQPSQAAVKTVQEKLLKKESATTTKVKTVVKAKSNNLQDQVLVAEQTTIDTLSYFKDRVMTIRTNEQLEEYISNAINSGYLALDTETNNSLDPLTCKLMGLCLYYKGAKAAYIPVNHTDLHDQLIDNQVTESQIHDQLLRLNDTKIIMHNGKFDLEVIHCTCNVDLNVYWDTMIGSQILDENESAKLKVQYGLHIDPTVGFYSLEGLYKKLPYAYINPDIFALYSATDALETFELYEYQKKQFELPDNSRIYKLFSDVEMKVLKVAEGMELRGISLDLDFAKRLSDKYHNLADDVDNRLDETLAELKPQIDKWRLTPEANIHPMNKAGTGEAKSKAEQLMDPPQLTSPTQFAILLYDVLKEKPVSKDSPRGTGEEILEKINQPICKLVLEKRGLTKLINTYIDKLPACINPADGKLHARFNQLGTEDNNVKTGRFSSSDPNLQNIPSHNKEIRMMFTASPGCVLVGSDFSQQEPRLFSNYSKDPNMMGAYQQGKDLYATMGAGVYKMDYWDCMEHHKDGSANPEGKKRRSNMKSLLLGIMYQRGAASIAEQLHCDYQEAQKIIDDFYEGFPKARLWIENTKEKARQLGYVEDLWGRRRRLPSIQLKQFEVISNESNFNPLLGSEGRVTKDLTQYEQELENCKSKKQVDTKVAELRAKGYTVLNNGGKIADAERQAVNSPVQGGAATMSKKAMVLVDNDPILNDLGAHIVLQIHDEFICECPRENADAVADRLTDVMKHAAEPDVKVPFKCDADIAPSWYYNDYGDVLREEFEGLLKEKSREEALEYVYLEHCECTRQQIDQFLSEVA